MGLLSEQYKMVKDTRNLLFEFCERINPAYYTQEIEDFGWGSIRNLHVHVAECYQSWLERFALKRPAANYDELGISNVGEMRNLFQKTDQIAAQFLNEYEDQPAAKLKGTVSWQKEEEELSVLWLFTHTVTHEFHHKGQILSMARHLGYIPVDTDLITPADLKRLS
ncbi:DUF664 domain-containing protein [Bacillus sp. FJAT-42376]|uniref:DinB family protein n=1 Tax=Bacillus sp. FJAT-42376 TaxID=2014076 RepID=UPI000F4E50E3|nr:DinB family protein [Bacillus sp. FJAT-42376]AZB42438.1 DUF664 domain-containing protein [Bacillus sp. FJAT-42376]